MAEGDDFDLVPVDHDPFEDRIIPPPYKAPGQDSMPAKIAGGVLGHMVKGAADMVMGPGRALKGELDPYSDEAKDWAAGTAFNMMTRSGRGVPEGAIGTGGGKLTQPEGIRAYHGSPHDFDKFDLSKIGTGEGAQAYGRGLYFAENPSVADMYSRVVTKNQPGWDGTTPPAFDAVNPQELAKIPEGMRGRIAASWQNNGEDVARNLARRMFEDSRGTEYSNALHSIANAEWKPPGHRYEVNIAAHPDQFLDWDKPLSEQPHVLEQMHNAGFQVPKTNDLSFLEKRASEEGPDSWYAMQLNGLKSALQKRPSEFNMQNPENVAALSKAGIPGIKYLDQGSRGSGEGTKNLVVFDDKLINIVRKYGMAGLAPLIAQGYFDYQTRPVDHDPFDTAKPQKKAAGGPVEEPKATKAKAHYRIGNKAKRCGICTMFRPPHSCTSVEGTIRPGGLCDYFEAKAAEDDGSPTGAVVRTYDVPWLAGSSNDNKTVFIDRRVPRTIRVKRANGNGYRMIDPAEPLSIHERSEHRAMNAGKSYEKAHAENGTADERAWVKGKGLDWDHYEEVLDGLLSHIEHEHPKRPPPTLYDKPYSHSKQLLLRKLEEQESR